MPLHDDPRPVVHFTVAGDTASVVVRGEIDYFVGAALRDALTTAAATNARRVVLDLDGHHFVDGRSITHVAAVAERLRRRGDRFVLVAPSASFLRLANVVGVDDLLAAHAGEDEETRPLRLVGCDDRGTSPDVATGHVPGPAATAGGRAPEDRPAERTAG